MGREIEHQQEAEGRQLQKFWAEVRQAVRCMYREATIEKSLSTKHDSSKLAEMVTRQVALYLCALLCNRKESRVINITPEVLYFAVAVNNLIPCLQQFICVVLLLRLYHRITKLFVHLLPNILYICISTSTILNKPLTNTAMILQIYLQLIR